ncbi:hypothetical protein PENTCL1PPCAC_5946, partial [Pristionchus entomophagus]
FSPLRTILLLMAVMMSAVKTEFKVIALEKCAHKYGDNFWVQHTRSEKTLKEIIQLRCKTIGYDLVVNYTDRTEAYDPKKDSETDADFECL